MNTKRLAYISMFTLLTIAGSVIKIPVPFTPILFSFQTLFVIMSGLVLGAKDAAISQAVYLALGIIGVPIFTGGGGFGYVFMPSFGYIIGFILGAFITGYIKSRMRTLSIFKLFVCGFFGLIGIYSVGIVYQVLILWFYTKNTFVVALLTVPSVLIMFVIDCILVYLVCMIYPKIRPLIGLIQDGQKEKKEHCEN